MEKICKQCNKEQVFCKEICRKCYGKNQYQKHKQYHLEYAKKYREANPKPKKEKIVVQKFCCVCGVEVKKYAGKERCKSCYGKWHREEIKKDPERLEQERDRCRKWRESNKEYFDQYYQQNKDKIAEKNRKWIESNREHVRERERKRRQENIQFKIKKNLQNRIYYALNGKNKSARTVELLGCSVEFLIGYLEAKFQDGMTWNNYGEWHVDHIRPCASFDLNDPEQQRECFHYTNLRPLWGSENISKNSDWNGKRHKYS